jgi:hypothetical protein
LSLHLNYAMSSELGIRTIHQRAKGRNGSLCGAQPLNDLDPAFATAVLAGGWATRCEACDAAAIHLGIAAHGTHPWSARHPEVAEVVALLDRLGFTPAVHYAEVPPGASGYSAVPAPAEAVTVVHLSRGEVAVPSLHDNGEILEGYRRVLREMGWITVSTPREWEVLVTRQRPPAPRAV